MYEKVSFAIKICMTFVEEYKGLSILFLLLTFLCNRPPKFVGSYKPEGLRLKNGTATNVISDTP